MPKETSIMRIIRAAIALQDTVAKSVPENKRQAGEGRIARLVVDDPGNGTGPGPDHTVLYFKIENGRLKLLDNKPAESTIRNEIIFLGDGGELTGVGLFTQALYDPLCLRDAVNKKWFIITDPHGDLAEYDAEEMLQLCAKLITKIAKKIPLP